MRLIGENQTHGRIHALDSLRGIAALAVCLSHATYFWAELPQVPATTVKALHAFMMWGHPAVILFFVLSGFVLTIGFGADRTPDYPQFIVQRVFRLYPANLAVLAAICAVTVLIDRFAPAALTPLMADPRPSVDFASAIGTAGLILTSQTQAQINFVVWSLVHEMRFSLVFPVMLLAMRGRIALFSLLCLLAYAAATFLLGDWPRDVVYMLSDQPLRSWLITLHYLPCFGAGMIAAALYRHAPAQLLGHPAAQAALVIASLCVPRYVHEDLLIAIWAAVLIVAVAQPGAMSRLLNLPALLWLGRISYSLYLVHHAVARYLFYAFGRGGHPGLVAAATVLLSLALAWLVNVAAERPGIAVLKRVRGTMPRVSADARVS